jgi:hypothetical protein
MQNYYFEFRGKEELERVRKSFHLFVKTLPVNRRSRLVHRKNQLIFTGTNMEFFQLGISVYFNTIVPNSKNGILSRLTSDKLYPTRKDPLKLTEHRLNVTKEIRSHIYGMGDDDIVGHIQAYLEIGRLYCGGREPFYFLDVEDEYEQTVMEVFNKRKHLHDLLTRTPGKVCLESNQHDKESATSN